MKKILIGTIIVAITLSISTWTIAPSFASSASERYRIGYDDACAGRVVPGSHTSDYRRGYADGQAACAQHNSPSIPSPPPPPTAPSVQQRGSNVVVTEKHVMRTEGLIFTIHYLLYGKVINIGSNTSNLVVLKVTMRDPPSMAGHTLYSTTLYAVPTVLRPGETGDYSLTFTSDDLRPYGSATTFWTFVNVVHQ